MGKQVETNGEGDDYEEELETKRQKRPKFYEVEPVQPSKKQKKNGAAEGYMTEEQAKDLVKRGGLKHRGRAVQIMLRSDPSGAILEEAQLWAEILNRTTIDEKVAKLARKYSLQRR